MTSGSLEARLRKLEKAVGSDELERRVRSMSDEEIDARVAELEADALAMMVERGLETEGLTAMQMFERLIAYEEARETP